MGTPRYSISEIAAFVGAFVFISGSTVSTLVFTSDTPQYYLATTIGALLCLPQITRGISNRRLIGTSSSVVGGLATISIVHAIFLDKVATFSFAPYGAIAVALGMAFAIAIFDRRMFRDLMTVVALVHVAICAYGLANFQISTDEARFDALGVGVALWGEIALGAIVAAVLSDRFIVLLASMPCSFIVIALSQMRGAGIAALIASTGAVFLAIPRRLRGSALTFALLASLTVFILFSTEISEKINAIFLLDDQYRGVDAGFSGRFDNWADGLEKFAESPLFGAGLADDTAAFTHNGALKVLAQLGLPFALFLFHKLTLALISSWKASDGPTFLSLLAYVSFAMTAPRYINFQVMPFLGVVAVSVALVRNSQTPAVPGP